MNTKNLSKSDKDNNQINHKATAKEILRKALDRCSKCDKDSIGDVGSNFVNDEDYRAVFGEIQSIDEAAFKQWKKRMEQYLISKNFIETVGSGHLTSRGIL